MLDSEQLLTIDVFLKLLGCTRPVWWILILCNVMHHASGLRKFRSKRSTLYRAYMGATSWYSGLGRAAR